MPTLIRRAIVLATVLFANLAFAQGVASEGILTQGTWCLDIPGNYSRTNPPPIGARVVAARCSGRITQRWTKLSGDYNRVDSIGGRRLSVGRSRRNGSAPVVLAESLPEIDLVDGQLRTYDALCVTRHQSELRMETCRPDDPAQRWALR